MGTGVGFGTYGVGGTRAAFEVRLALERGIRHIDTARLYKNENEVYAAIRAFEAECPDASPVRVCSKVHKNLHFEATIAAVEDSARRLGRPLDRMLLHRPLPNVMWRALNACVERGLVIEIGVSNYSVARLTDLLGICEAGIELGAPCRRPDLLQTEFHPFVGAVHPLLSFCHAQQIAVQGHTMLARGELLAFPPLVQLADRYGASPAVMMLRWARQLGVELLVHSSNEAHLDEILADTGANVPVLQPRDMAELSGYYATNTRRFFNDRTPQTADRSLDAITDTEQYIDAVVERLERDREALASGDPISQIALGLSTQTTRELLTDPVANRIALRLSPASESKSLQSSYGRYRDLVRLLRSRAAAKASPKSRSCALPLEHPAHAGFAPRVVGGQPVAAAVAHPTAMPVEVAPVAELEPFFRFLADPDALAAGELERPLTFARGTYFADQRMDLCKQVVGPQHIGRLCDAVQAQSSGQVAPQHRVRHFLLGNNIACAGDSTAGAEALARLMADPAIAIETWYLAGNCIGPDDLGVLAASLASNQHAKALWLKRNPLGARGGAHLGRLLRENHVLELLDLHNTGLFDEGVEALCEELQSGKLLSLQHLYLSANALTERSLVALGSVLCTTDHAPCSLVSLHLSMNRLGNSALPALIRIIESGALAKLERLDLGSTGLQGPCLAALVDALCMHCPRLRALNLGTYRATRDLGETKNELSADVDALERLLQRHPAIELVDLSLCGLTEADGRQLVGGLRSRQSIQGIGPDALRHDAQERRFLKHTECVVHIDSLYRGRA